MQRQKVVKRTFGIAFKILLYLFLFFIAGVISYKVTLYLGGNGKRNTSTKNSSTAKVVEARTDEIAQNLVLSVGENTAEVQSIVLEIFNTNTKNIDLITIPASTKITMSQELYTKLLNVNDKVPQIITLSDIGQYFDQEVAYEYETLILNEFLDTDISFYSAMLTDEFAQYFTKQKSGAYTFKDNVVTKWKGYTKAEEYLDEMMEYYRNVQSNLTLTERKNYASSYLNANYNYIHTYVLKEEYEDGKYTLDEQNQNLVDTIIKNESTYTNNKQNQTTTTTTSAEVSKTSSIKILNSTGIAGLAAKYGDTLKQKGYTVGNIGNYTGQAHVNTKIVVKEEGLGADLKSYFNSAVVETGTVDGGYDILIILGSKDA